MTRYIYGGGGDGDIVSPTGTPYANASASVYTARSGGTQVTDLQNITGTAVTVVTTDANGQAIFYGPDGYIDVLWLDFGAGSGVRWALSPKDVDQAALKAIANQRAADNSALSHTIKAALPYNTNDPLETSLANALDAQVIPRFASQTARDSAFPTPADGDRCWRTDLSMMQIYSVGQGGWRNQPSLYNTSPGNQTIFNTASEFAFATLNIPANDAAQGSCYRIKAWGTLTCSGTPTVTFKAKIGGIGGLTLATSGALTPGVASAGNRTFSLEANVSCLQTGVSGAWFGVLQGVQAFTMGSGSNPYLNAPTILDGISSVTKDTTVLQQFALTVQWSTASTGNTCAIQGWYAEKIS